MVEKISAIILKTNLLETTVRFYRLLGVPLTQEESDGDGPTHFSHNLKGVHFGVYELDPWTQKERRASVHDTMVGFEVTSLEAALENLKELQPTMVIEPESVPSGRRCVILDPDGRPVELTQVSPESKSAK